MASSIPLLPVHDSNHGFSRPIVPHVLGKHIDLAIDLVDCAATGMLREDGAGTLPERIILRQWLGIRDIQYGTVEMARLQAMCEGVLIHDGASPKIYKDRPPFHLSKKVLIKKPSCQIGLGCSADNDIRIWK